MKERDGEDDGVDDDDDKLPHHSNHLNLLSHRNTLMHASICIYIYLSIYLSNNLIYLSLS